MYVLVLLRHGESIWNKENRFTGWTDIDLSKKGIDEAKKAGQLLKKEGFTFDVAFTSNVTRSVYCCSRINCTPFNILFSIFLFNVAPVNFDT